MGPGERANLAAKAGTRYHLDASDIVSGTIAWMPWAGVIKVTHKDRQKGASDGVEVLGQKPGDRPRQRAWNHSALIPDKVKSDRDRVHILPITTFRGKSLLEKFKKHKPEARRFRLERIMILGKGVHPLEKEGKKEYKSLKLEAGAEMMLKSFVKLDTVYAMDWMDLQRYDKSGKRKVRVDAEGMKRVKSVLKVVNGRCWKEMRGGTGPEAEKEKAKVRKSKVPS